MIRSVYLWVVYGVINTLFWIILGILLTLVSASTKTIHYYCAVPWSKIILWGAGVRVQVQGLSHIQGERSYIFIPNHLSFFDIFSLLAHLPAHFKFILKEELMRIPVLGWSMKRAGYISIDRSSPARTRLTFRRAVERIKGGTSLVIFAEGTRSPDGMLQPLKRGAFQLAIASGCPIVPVAITGTREIMPKGSLKIHRGSVRIQIGIPIEIATYTRETLPELMDKVTGALLAMLGQAPQ